MFGDVGWWFGCLGFVCCGLLGLGWRDWLAFGFVL